MIHKEVLAAGIKCYEYFVRTML